MGTTPSVFEKTPDEHVRAAQRLTKEAKRRGVVHRFAPVRPPPGYVRVHFYTDLEKLHRELSPDLYADVPLERSGELDLRKVNAIWGLEGCLPIDPMRWTVFQPGNPHRLSAVAVQVLSEGQGCIKFIEPSISKSTYQKRMCREAVVTFLFVITSLVYFCYQTTYDKCLEVAEACTPIPQLYRRSWRQRKRFNRRIELYASMLKHTQIDFSAVLRVCVLLVFVVGVVAVTGGYLESVSQRARNWARTGSLLL